jgi:AcrR family transcriptional regulator
MKIKKYIHIKNKDDLAKSLIDAAVDYISNKKSTAFALRELSKTLGVSHAAAYRHFKSKQALLEKIAQIGYQKMNVHFFNSLKNSKYPIKDLGRAYIKFATTNPGYYRVMFSVDFGKDLNLELTKECQDSFDALINLFGKKDKKKITKAVYAWSTVHGFVMLLLDGQIKISIKKYQIKSKDIEKRILEYINAI